MSRIQVDVPLGDRSYPILVERGGYGGLGDVVRGRVPSDRVVLVTESTVGPLWGDEAGGGLRSAGLQVSEVVLPAGEANKTLDTWQRCIDALLQAGLDRRTAVVALGGGVLGDLAGFAAATALRGVPFVQLPTTLLAMVDASVGGKTAVNHPLGKNLVGAFHQPTLVFAALDTLSTLPDAERVAGLGEVVKTAVLGDADLLDVLERDAEALRRGDAAALAPVVARCVALKAEVVGRDEREAGWRAVLNYGHTVGHALEAVAGFGALRHGEAVALGLVAETAWAVREGLCDDPGLVRRLATLLHRLGLPTVPPNLDRDGLVAAMRVDKKARGDMLVVPVPVRAGEMVLATLPATRLADLLPEPA